MSYSTSISAESSNTAAPTRITLPFHSGLVEMPQTWRRLVLFVCPHLQHDDEATTGVSTQASQDEHGGREHDYPTFGASHNHSLSRGRPSPTAEPSTAAGASSIEQRPSHRPNSIIIPEPPKDRTSWVDFIDTRFLSPRKQLFLSELRQLSGSPTAPTSVLVQLGDDKFWMNSKDADILLRLKEKADKLSPREKREMARSLAPLPRLQDRYPLRQVLHSTVEIVSEGFKRISEVGYNDSTSYFPTTLQDHGCDGRAPEVLRAAPLRVHSLGQGHFQEAKVLSPLPEVSEPRTPAVQPRGRPSPALPASTGQDAPKGAGSVSKARAGLRPPEHPLKFLESSVTDSKVERARKISSPRSFIDLIEALRTDDNSKADDDSFVNPRSAPTPPVKPSRPVMVEAPKQPGSVRRARTALASTEALNQLTSKSSSLISGDSSESFQPTILAKPSFGNIYGPRVSSLPRNASANTSSESLKQPGSVRRARQNLAINPYKPSQRPVRISDAVPEGPTNPPPVSTRLNYQRAESSGVPKQKGTVTDARVYLRALENRNNLTIDPQASQRLVKEAIAVRGSPAHSLAVDRSPERPVSSQGILVTKNIDVSSNVPCLRGGADETETDASAPSQPPRKKISTIFGRVPRLEDDERPHRAIWWFAGGKVGNRRKVPTAGELRERRKVEEANRDVVGFFGTVAGVRVVRRMPAKVAEAASHEDDGEEAEQAEGESDKEAAKAEME